MLRTPGFAALLLVLAVAGCGSADHASTPSTPDSHGTTTGHAIPASAPAAVKHALGELSSHPFDESFQEVAHVRVSGLPAAVAQELAPALRSAQTRETGEVHVTNASDFRGRVTVSKSGTEYVRVTPAAFEVSTDGVHYQPAPDGERQALTSFVRSGLTFLGRGARHVQDRGRKTVDGVAVEEYRGIFSGAAVKAQFGSLVTLPARATIGDGVTILDVDRATGLPVHMVDTISLSAPLNGLSAGLPGRLTAVVTDTRAFSHVG